MLNLYMLPLRNLDLENQNNNEEVSNSKSVCLLTENTTIMTKEIEVNASELPIGIKNKREFPPIPSTDPRDIPCVRFTEAQTEEIMACDYSLMLFHATRVQALSVNDILERFKEPEIGVTELILSKFFELGILVKQGDKYYTAHPGNFPNFTNHTYDIDLETEKDAKVFALLKEHAGDREYWKTQNYFSTDGFFTDEQAQHIRKLLLDIKFYIKNTLKLNAESGTLEGKTFRRHKFYDLVIGLCAFLLIFTGGLKAQASNDPGSQIALSQKQFREALQNADRIIKRNREFSSNDPGGAIQRSSFESIDAQVQLASSSDGGYGIFNAALTSSNELSCADQGRMVSTISELSDSCLDALYLSVLDLCESTNNNSNFCESAKLF